MKNKYNYVQKEISEELGIEIDNKAIARSLKPCYLKSGGEKNFLSAIFKLDLLINEGEINHGKYVI